MNEMPIPSAKTRLGRLMRLPLRLVPAERPIRILTGPLAGKRWVSTSHTHGCWLGTYERDLQETLVSHLRAGDTFFDVGANVGFFTLLGSTLVGKTGSVVAFEPLPRNVALLRRHVAMNGLENVTVIAAAVADAPGSGFLSPSRSSAQGSLKKEGIAVSVVAIDDLLSRGGLRRPTVLKIDVEGAESRVLAGARNLLEVFHPLLLLSTHGSHQHATCWRYLQELGYELVLRRDGRSDHQYESVASYPRGGERP